MSLRFVVLAVWMGCSTDEAEPPVDDSDEEGPLSWDVLQPGPHHVGYRFETITYTTRDGRERSVGMGAWYPTDDTTGGEVRYTDSFPKPLDGILGDATPAAPHLPGGWPLAVHSHGHQATHGSGQPVGAWLASHGWLVVAPDHLPDTFSTIVSGGSTPPEHWIDRPSDVTAALDYVSALPAGHVFAGKVDAHQALLSGHSRGVSTLWTTLGCAFDPASIPDNCPGCAQASLDVLAEGMDEARFVAGVALAGSYPDGLCGADGYAGVTEPVLALTGSANDVGQAGLAARVPTVDLTQVELEGGCHESFASGLPCPTLDTDLGFHVIGVYTLAFARQRLLGDDSSTTAAVLDGTTVVDPLARVNPF